MVTRKTEYSKIHNNELILVPDTSDPDITYFGQSDAGNWTTAGRAAAVWKIWIVDSSGRTLFADGDSSEDKIWDDRAGYTYK